MTTPTVVDIQHQPAAGAALQQALAAKGYQVLVLDAGGRARTVIHQQQPAVVVLALSTKIPAPAGRAGHRAQGAPPRRLTGLFLPMGPG